MKTAHIDVQDEQQVARFLEIVTVASQFERPHYRPETLRELTVELRNGDPSGRLEALGAFEGDEMLGAAFVWYPLLDNTDLLLAMAFVEPGRRGQGIGSTLVDGCVRRAEELGRHTLMTQGYYPVADRDDHPYRRFAERHRFALASTEVVRELELPVSGALLADLAAEAAPHHTAYRLETFVDGIPDELAPSYCDAQNQLSVDAPSGDFEFEEEQSTPEVLKARLAVERDQGRARVTTVAVHPDDGVVAYTDLVLAENGRLDQYGTLVRKEHRGHRLGLAVKARNLQEFQHRHPGSYRIQTGNAEVNGHMVSINERLGFRVIELCAEFKRALPD